MTKPVFATYLHSEVMQTSRPATEIEWMGHSHPYFSRVREELARALDAYPALPVRREPVERYESVHTPSYLEQLRRFASRDPLATAPKLSLECSGMEHCLPGYEFTLGGLCEAIDRMRAGTLDRAYCFGLVGHHAHPDWGHGYCMLHPQAAAVRYAQQLGFKRVLILDWDIHHGDGTQAIFASDSSVYCVSIHSGLDLYMMRASSLEACSIPGGQAVGHCNIPLLHTLFQDDWMAEHRPFSGSYYRAAESLAAFEQALAALPWKPDLVCVCSGYDSHRDDCGADITDWTEDDFRHLTRLTIRMARQASCPILSVHSGGYQLGVTIRAASEHVRVLAND
jgi:acetoin utilization deacetylase AcuC-like enzyme